MTDRSRIIYRLITVCLLACTSCNHRQTTATAAPPTKPANPVMLSVVAPVVSAQHRTFKGSGIQFDYPADWQPAKCRTALFSVAGPLTESTSPSLCLDVPTLPWHLPGMITLSMVCKGYISDLKKNQIHDAVVSEQCPVMVNGETGKRVTCTGHIAGKTTTDIAVILVHSDQVYILSADSDDSSCTCARKTLDDAVASMKWAK